MKAKYLDVMFLVKIRLENRRVECLQHKFGIRNLVTVQNKLGLSRKFGVTNSWVVVWVLGALCLGILSSKPNG